MLSSLKFDKKAINATDEGKTAISLYLAKNIHRLNIKKDLFLDIDSELIVKGCECEPFAKENCQCNTYASPIRGIFTKEGYQAQHILEHICQRKGEAEMSQVDWLVETVSTFEAGDIGLRVVSS